MPLFLMMSLISQTKLCYFWINFALYTQPQNIHQLQMILFHHLNNAMSLILVQFPPGLKLSGPFIWAEAERGTPSGNRCSGCLMLACGGPAGLETWSNHDPILETHDTVAVPSHLLSDEAARCQKYTQLCWIKHLTHWLPDWWWDRRSYPGDEEVWDLPHLHTQLITQVNEKVSVKLLLRQERSLTATPAEGGSCPAGCGAESGCFYQENQIFIPEQLTPGEQESVYSNFPKGRNVIHSLEPAKHVQHRLVVPRCSVILWADLVIQCEFNSLTAWRKKKAARDGDMPVDTPTLLPKWQQNNQSVADIVFLHPSSFVQISDWHRYSVELLGAFDHTWQSLTGLPKQLCFYLRHFEWGQLPVCMIWLKQPQ